MAKKKQTAAVKKTTVTLEDLFPRITIFPGEDKTSFEDLRQGFMVDLAPSAPYEVALVENLVTLEWEAIRHRNIRDQLILNKFHDLSLGALQYAEIKSIRGERIDQEVHEEARALMSSDPRQRAVGLSALEERHINPTELLAEAYTEVRHAIEVHEYKLVELELRRRRLREDYDRLKAARSKPVEDAEVLSG